MFLNIAAPEIVLGTSLLSFFVLINFPLGLVRIFVAHVMFNVAFVAVTVRARLSGFHREIDDAAADLYATPWQAFWRVTLPLIWPGILADALLAFALSIDDFVITNFVAGITLNILVNRRRRISTAGARGTRTTSRAPGTPVPTAG